jgi:hypothetical protein
LDIADWVKLVGYVASILVACTALLNYSGNIPSWWFSFSFIFLMILIFSVPLMIFANPISEKIRNFNETKKQDSVVQRHFKEFQSLVDKFQRALYPISELWSMIKQQCQIRLDTRISISQSHERESSAFPLYILEKVEFNSNQMQNRFYGIAAHCERFRGDFGSFSLLIDEFSRFLNDAEKQVQILSVYATEMKLTETNPQIVKRYEEFREQYNIFANAYIDYCHRLNQELGGFTFPAHIECIKKW